MPDEENFADPWQPPGVEADGGALRNIRAMQIGDFSNQRLNQIIPKSRQTLESLRKSNNYEPYYDGLDSISGESFWKEFQEVQEQNRYLGLSCSESVSCQTPGSGELERWSQVVYDLVQGSVAASNSSSDEWTEPLLNGYTYTPNDTASPGSLTMMQLDTTTPPLIANQFPATPLGSSLFPLFPSYMDGITTSETCVSENSQLPHETTQMILMDSDFDNLEPTTFESNLASHNSSYMQQPANNFNIRYQGIPNSGKNISSSISPYISYVKDVSNSDCLGSSSLDTPSSSGANTDNCESRHPQTHQPLRLDGSGYVHIQPAQPKIDSAGSSPIPAFYRSQREYDLSLIKRERKAMAKQKASAVRAIEACMFCRRNKRPCSAASDEACDGCKKRSLTMNPHTDSRYICIRGTLTALWQGFDDFFDTRERKQSLPSQFTGSIHDLEIGDLIWTSDALHAFFPTKRSLVVSVQQYSNHKLESIVFRPEGSRGPEIPEYSIVESSQPTASELDDWGRNLMSEYSHHISDFRPPSMDTFLFSYIKTLPKSPMWNLVNLTISLVSLSTWLFEYYPVIDYNSATNQAAGAKLLNIQDKTIHRRLADVARQQLILIAAEGFQQSTSEFLFEIDTTLKNYPPNPQDACIIGFCLRRVSMVYLCMRRRYEKFLSHARLDRRREKPKAMQYALTVGFSLVYHRALTPYDAAWSVQDHMEAFGHDNKLADLFVKHTIEDKQRLSRVKTVLEENDDVHFRNLVLNRKSPKQMKQRRKG